jgi:hypothetical protein
MLSRSLQYALNDFRLMTYSAYNRFRIGSQAAPKILVNGVPKTGTTWLARLLSTMPGQRRIGDFEFDIQRYWEVEPGDVVHGHDRYSKELHRILRETGIKTVVTMRDPRDQVVSHMFHVRRLESHPWNQRVVDLSEDDALMLCIEGREGSTADTFFGGVGFWAKFNREWSTQCPEVHFVRYEDFLARPAEELGGLTRELGFEAGPGLIEAVVERNSFDRLIVGKKIWKQTRARGQGDAKSFYRKGVAGDWKEHFKPHHVERFKELGGDYLIEWGYEKDYDWSAA